MTASISQGGLLLEMAKPACNGNTFLVAIFFCTDDKDSSHVEKAFWVVGKKETTVVQVMKPAAEAMA
jgi:hypothetical protein